MVRKNQNDTNRYGWNARRQYRRERDAALKAARGVEAAHKRSEAVRYARRMNHYVIASLRG